MYVHATESQDASHLPELATVKSISAEALWFSALQTDLKLKCTIAIEWIEMNMLYDRSLFRSNFCFQPNPAAPCRHAATPAC